MGHGLYLAVIQQKSSFHQRFAVTSGTGAYDLHAFGQERVDLLQGTDRCLQGASVVTGIERVQQGSIFTYQSNLRGGGTGIDTQESLALIGL